MQKFVLVRPLGGLTDMFSQIYKCFEYCQQFNRILIIDTISCTFKDDFINYFDPLFDNYYTYNNWLNDFNIKNMSVYPLNAQKQLFNNTAKNVKGSNCRVIVVNNISIPLTFDFNIDYIEDVLIHHAGGGGSNSRYIFNNFKIRKYLQDELINRLKTIGGEFISVHIRNTDIKAFNYPQFINDHINKLTSYNNIFIGTDSFEVLDYFYDLVKNDSRFNSSKLYSFSKLLSLNGKAIHKERKNKKKRNDEAILDLLTLSAANELIHTPIIKKDKLVPLGSGFTRLARYLNDIDYVKNNIYNGEKIL